MTLCDSMDYSLPGSSVHGILQARILEWVAISPFRGSSRPRDLTCASYSPTLVGRVFFGGGLFYNTSNRNAGLSE